MGEVWCGSLGGSGGVGMGVCVCETSEDPISLDVTK